MRFGLSRLIGREPDLTVVAEAKDGAEAAELGLQLEIDVAILDVAMPRKTGLQVTKELARERPAIRILILSMHDNEQYMLAAARAGAAGYMLKSDADEHIVAACRALLEDKAFLAPHTISASLREELERARDQGEGRDDILTLRELEVLKLVAEGNTSKEIAHQLTITVKTVDRHRSNIMSKLDVTDRVQLARHAIRRGLIEP